ncbi:MAG: DUF6465 family protein [Muribaculaceae bacterium]|nr:DUF6465 family protein [Muribaculaceae bacterium]
MAETKKTAVAKATAKAAEAKKEEATTTAAVQEAPKAEAKKPAAKAEAKKPAAKKTAAKKTTTKKAAKTTTEKATTTRAAKKAESTAVVHLQFAGKSYTTEDLVKSAKDVWQYDLNQKPEDFKTVALYVKPEENLVYYVINDDVSGNFYI